MSGHIVKLHATAHEETQALLPWFVLDTLDSDEREMVQAHLQVCAHCQADVDFQRKLSAVPLANDSAVDVERAFAALRPQLNKQRPGVLHNKLTSFLHSFWHGAQRPWMPWALGAQFAAITGLCLILLQPAHDAPYRGLGMSASVNGNLVVAFKPQTTEQELRRILHASGARVVDGPTVTDAYLLKVSAGQQAHALALLRAEPAVVLAESLESGGAR